MTTEEFIAIHRTDDLRRLALHASLPPGAERRHVLQQIEGWQIARRKLPLWADTGGITYPPRLSMEQCSSQPAAMFKAAVARKALEEIAVSEQGQAEEEGSPWRHDGRRCPLVDLTGGLGADFSFMARGLGGGVYVERSADLCASAAANFAALGLENVTTVCADAADHLRSMPPCLVAFVDPARRDAAGRKVAAVADCSPDVAAMLPLLRRKALLTMVKLSPMLDWHKAAEDFAGGVSDIYFVESEGECKEMLLLVPGGEGTTDTPALHCALLSADGPTVIDFRPSGEEGQIVPPELPLPSVRYLYEPGPAAMKTGCFDAIARMTGTSQLAPNSHLFVSDSPAVAFPGRAFRVRAVLPPKRKAIADALGGIGRANITVRNFPLTAEQLRSKLRLHDGGNTYLFATTARDNAHIVFVAEKA